MRTSLAASFLLCWSLLLMGKTCGSDLGDKEAGEPCTRASECAGELRCIGGVCQLRPDGGVDQGDAGVDGGADADGGSDGGLDAG